MTDKLQRYLDGELPLDALAPDERAEAAQWRELLADAVKIRLRADVPVGSYLSGGLDSSIISMLIATRFNNRLRTFSMRFQEEAFDESSYQDELIAYLGVDHRSITIENQQIRKLFPRTIWHCETPVLRTAPVPLYILSGLVHSEGFRVVLSGEGADEILGGYNIFKEAKVRRFWGREPESAGRPPPGAALPVHIQQSGSRAAFSPAVLQGVAPGPGRPAVLPHDPVGKQQEKLGVPVG